MESRSPVEAESATSVRIRVKAVPGAKRDQIAGMLGDRLKVRVSAPPEGGRANAAICALLGAALGLRARDIEVIAGPTSPEKVVRATGIDASSAAARLGRAAQAG